MKTHLIILSILGFTLCGCKTTSPKPQHFPVVVQDNAEEQKFDISMQNTTAKAVCISVENWPNNIGELHYAADILYIEIASDTYPIFDSNLGYCPKGCGTHKIEAGETLKGNIPYKLFAIPEHQKTSKKKLHFTPAAFKCRNR